MPHRERDSTAQRPLLRGAAPRDWRRLWRLDQICFERGIAYSQPEIRRFLAFPGAEGVVAEEAGEIAGFALGYPMPPQLGRVVTLDVHPAFRRRGLGRLLMETLIERLAARGAERVTLEVDVRNSGALAFYRAFGFRETGRLPDYYGPGLDAFEMEIGIRGYVPKGTLPSSRLADRAHRRPRCSTDF